MGIAERRKRERLKRRNDILNAAETVFFEKGFNATTMDDVAGMAELSKGTIYLYFKNKGELYFSLTYRALMSLHDRFNKVLNSDLSGLDQIREIGIQFYHFSKEEPDYYKTIALFEMSQLESSETEDDVALKCHKVGQGVMKLVAQAIINGIQDGTIRKDLDPLKTAFLLQGLSNGVIQLIAREGKHIHELEGFEAENLLDDFFSMMKYALAVNSEK